MFDVIGLIFIILHRVLCKLTIMITVVLNNILLTIIVNNKHSGGIVRPNLYTAG